MTDAEWLKSCAHHVAQAKADRGGAPLGWLARAAEKEKEARAEFGDEAFEAELERQAAALGEQG